MSGVPTTTFGYVPPAAGYPARTGASLAPRGDGPAVTVSISPGGAAASGAIAEPNNNQPLTPAGYIRVHLNNMFHTSGSRLQLTYDFEKKLTDYLAAHKGKINLNDLMEMIKKDVHLSGEDIREDSFFGIFGNGDKEVSFDTLKANIAFFEPILSMRMDATGEGLLQVLRCKLTFYKMQGTEGEKDNMIGLARQDNNRFKQHMEMAWSVYVNSASDQTEASKRRKEYADYQTALEGNTDPAMPSGVKELVFQSYLVEFDAYCITNNIDRNSVDMSDKTQKENFLKGVFSDFVVRGQVDKTKLSGSFGNFFRKSDSPNNHYSLNKDVLAAYPKTAQPQSKPDPSKTAVATPVS